MSSIVGFIDFEASSLPQKWQKKDDFPIEVGISFLAAYEGLHRPRKISWHSKLILHSPWLENGLWSPAAERLHKITPEDLVRDGESVDVAAEWMNCMLSNCGAVYADSPLDQKWCAQLFNEAGLRPAFEIQHVKRICDEALYINEQTLAGIIHGEIRTVLDEEGGNIRHRAGPDAARLACAFAASTVRPVDVAPPPEAAFIPVQIPAFSC